MIDLTTIQAAARRLQPSLAATPLLQSPDLNADVNQSLWLKAENLQRTGSFKSRGALNWVLTASDAELANGLVTVSAGNHALALAWAAGKRQVPVTVFMPDGSSPLKIDQSRALGADVRVHGSIQQAVELCHQMQEEEGRTLVHPYADWRVMAGQGTVGLELLQQLPEMARIVCPVGGGGLISGLGLAVRAQRPDIELIGVEPEGAATLGNAWAHNEPTAALDRIDTVAASLAPAMVAESTFQVSRRYVNRLVTVSDEAIRKATLMLVRRGRMFVETGAATALAALLEKAVDAEPTTPTVLIMTGGNQDLAPLAQWA